MKNIILFTGLFVLLLTSCVREEIPDPRANFGVDYSLVEPDEVVFFTNNSTDADYFEWNFGDGYSSKSYSPSHAYKNEGVYRVSLAAFHGNRVDYTYLDIEVYMTTLEVEVIEYYSEQYVPNVEVALYRDYYDWTKQTYNYDGIGFTDNKGIIVFKGVDDISYYIDAMNSSYDNRLLEKEDINFIYTAPLEHAKHNVFTAKVDYYPSGKIAIKSTKMTVKPSEDRPKRSAKNLTRVKEK